MMYIGVFAGVICVAAFAGELPNVARMPGVVAVADSQSRDRWGWDGYHPACVHDGNIEEGGRGSRTACWASDNWEVTHALALVFPKRLRAQQVIIHWPKLRGARVTPLFYTIQGLREGRWQDLVQHRRGQEEVKSAHAFPATSVDSIRVVMPAQGAHPAADRRLWIAELEVMGEPEDPAHPVGVAAVAERIANELHEQRAREDAARVAPLLEVVMRRPKPRGFMSIVDRDDLKRGRQNVASRRWAGAFADHVKRDADWWVGQSDDYIYNLIPEGNPRALCPQFEKGCPIHAGARGSFDATLEKPYQWRCKRGGEWWYDGAVVKNPTTGEPVTVRDDGRGWLAPAGFPNAGRRYFFVAAYRYFVLGKLFSSPYEGDGGSLYRGGTPVVQLALAYALTGDERYAHKCAVMLSRLAELYPTYDGCVEGPSQRQDGYIGQTFERFLVQNLILACDLIWDTVERDADLRKLLEAKGNADHDRDGRVTGRDFTYNLQRNLLGYVYDYLHRLMPYMDGDFLMYEMTALAALGHCLGNPEIVTEALESDLGLRVMLTNSWFRDGKFVYDASGYNMGNALTPLSIAEWLHGFRAAAQEAEAVDLYHHPEYRMSMLFDFLRHIDCDGRVPQIGDCDGPRSCKLRLKPTYDAYDERALVRLPEQRDFYLTRLLEAAGGDLEAYRRGAADWWLVFHAGPEHETAPQTSGVAQPRSHLFPDSGIAILRAGSEAKTRQHVCLTFSKGSYGHGHADKLAINIIRYGYDLSADLGYPGTWTDIKCGGWVKHTASHCTVMLDGQPQRSNIVGRQHLFATQSLCDVVEASGEAAYPDASLYRRTVALVRDDAGEPLYTVDIFRVAGATTRDYLFHSLGKPDDFSVTAQGQELSWEKQTEGSLAGEDVKPMTQGGYAFLHDVNRAKTDLPVTARWLPKGGGSQGDRYLLTRRAFRDLAVEFTMTRTGAASGKRERSLFVFGVDPANQRNRRCAWLDAGGRLPVGKPVRVRVEVSGKSARVYQDGKLQPRGVDTSGEPLDEGVVGFLHYYNYAYDYCDLVLTPADGPALRVDLSTRLDPELWGKVDPTYSVDKGVLRARDAETMGLDLHLLGAPGREIIRAKGEGYGLRGQSPLEGHLIARDRVRDASSASAFAAVIETHLGQARVVDVTPMAIRPDGDAVALRVRTRDRVDYVISALDAAQNRVAELDGERVEFRGRFGFVATRGGEVDALGLVAGGFIECQGKRLESRGDVLGKIVRVDVEHDALLVQLEPGSAKPSSAVAGQHMLVHNPAFVCPSVYEVTGVKEDSAGLWRVQVSMPLAVARGVVRSIDAARGSFATRTPVMKLRVNPGLFNGKRVRARASSDSPSHVLKSATEAAFVLADPAGLGDFAVGGEYVVYDVGAGDGVEVLASCELRGATGPR